MSVNSRFGTKRENNKPSCWIKMTAIPVKVLVTAVAVVRGTLPT